MKAFFIERHSSVEKLEVEVEGDIADGWELVGGVSAVFDGDRVYYMQALTKEVGEED